MRRTYDKQLDTLHTGLIHMGALCEDAIACAAKALLEGDDSLCEKAVQLEEEIDLMNKNIEQQCVRLLLHQQPMASDLRQVTVAQKMVTDMERIGDQAVDIAQLHRFIQDSQVKSDVHIADMARATIKMVTDSVEAFVRADAEAAAAVIAYDDVVDGLFESVKSELVVRLEQDSSVAGDCLDLLMIAKYFERIGDHAVNIAEWVLYYITGQWASKQGEYQ